MKKNVEIFEEVPQDYYSKKLNKNKGIYANCYYLENSNLVYKEYNDGNNYMYIENILPLIGFVMEGYTFVNKFVGITFDNEINIKGHLLDYIKGLAINDCYEDITFNDFIKVLENLEENIANLSKEKVVAKDIHGNNLIYNEGKLISIDTDEFFKVDYENFISDKKGIDLVLYQNYREYNQWLIDMLFPPATLKHTFANLNNKDYNRYLQMAIKEGVIKPSALLEIFKTYFESMYGYEIDTLNNFETMGLYYAKKHKWYS